MTQTKSVRYRISWLTVSKAFFKSRKTTALTFPRSKLYIQESVASRWAVTVEWIVRKPDRYLYNYKIVVCPICLQLVASYSLKYFGCYRDNGNGAVIVQVILLPLVEKWVPRTLFQSSRNIPRRRLSDWLKITHRGEQVRSATSRISLADVSSKPIAFDLSNVLRNERSWFGVAWWNSKLLFLLVR